VPAWACYKLLSIFRVIAVQETIAEPAVIEYVMMMMMVVVVVAIMMMISMVMHVSSCVRKTLSKQRGKVRIV
jgi:hypothetical protein